ncbi:hypothetical protein J5N97_024848 [Dioscorea zingiberensis]|uniref:Aminotransferase-like plant mobile domain-containing protein n=1 Tax=Dioscorea zingiberensis TaxID=325984 RepID=A0A9D5C772_9LILI|nr:hypothetical protein J5N97_024848 [Dioscorea zingiberensis]
MRKVDIFYAIQASTYRIRKIPSLVLGVALFWCRETNTFLFRWGKATFTLKDVMVLGCYSVLGEPVQSGSLLGELSTIKAQMVEAKRMFNKSSCKKVHHSVWMKHYFSEGNGGELEHIGFLLLWLSRYVLPVYPLDIVRHNVFPISIKLAQGTRIALASAVLANLYHDLGVINNHGPSLVFWAYFKILHLWVWERFFTLSPEFPKFVDSDAPRAARWNGIVRDSVILYVRTVIERHSGFQWRPYATSLDNYVDGDDDLRSFVRCLRVCELVGMDCTEKYFLNRVAKQFGLDQDIPMHELIRIQPPKLQRG